MNVKTFDINLGGSAEEKWGPIVKHFEPQIDELKNTMNKICDSYIGGFTETILRTAIANATNSILYLDELKYLSEKLGIQFHRLVFTQLIYEMSSACTIVSDKINNERIIFRTMDWELPVLKKFTFNGNFYRDGKLIYKATCWLGCMGIYTACNSNYFIGINYRRLSQINTYNIMKNIYSIINMNWPVSYLTRFIFENSLSYPDALDTLKTKQIISPVYYTIINENDCIVINRSPTGIDNLYKNINIVQCNNDFDKTEPDIMLSNQRRNLGNKILSNKPTQNEFYEKLSKNPIINTTTIYMSKINLSKYTLDSIC